jgi:DNA-binding transcriptional LysR family regulator
MIEVHLLRYALAAAESGSFSRAAEQFRVKQSTLSKRVRHLELRLGVPLFTRSTQGVAPTPSGLRFLARARTIMGDLDSLASESLEVARGISGKLRIGFHGSLAAGDLRAIIEDYRREAADVDLEAVEECRDKLFRDLDRDNLDVAIMAGGSSDTCRRSLPLWSEPLVLGVPLGHALLERDRLYWTDLGGVTFLVTRADPGDLIAAMIAARLTGPAHRPTVIAQAVSAENLHGLATQHRLAMTTGVAHARPDMVFREVHDAFGPTRLDHGIHWRDHNDNPALRLFLSIVARRYGRAVSGSG